MLGYHKVRVMAAGRYADCWQEIEEPGTEKASVLRYVNDESKTVELPEPCEVMVLDKHMYFAPGIHYAPDVEAPIKLFS